MTVSKFIPGYKIFRRDRNIESDALESKAIRSHDPADWQAFKCYRNDVNNQIKLARQSDYKTAFN